MSADRRSLCPACLAKVKGVPIADLTVGELYQDEAEFAAYQENYIDKGFLVISYGAECQTCGYSVSYNHREPLPEET